MAIATWFDYETYMKNKLAQMVKTDPTWTAAKLQSAFDAAGFARDEGAQRHFEAYGKAEGVSPNALFNVDEYRAAKTAQFKGVANPTPADVAEVSGLIKAAGMTAWDHYVKYGAMEGVEPSFSFDAAAYCADKAKVMGGEWTAEKIKTAIINAGMTPLSHFMEYGGAGPQEVASTYATITSGSVQNPYVDTTPPSVISGKSFTLTKEADSFFGTDGNDVFTANQDTYNEADRLMDSNTGDNDVLNLHIAGNITDAPTVMNIENINISVATAGAFTFEGGNIFGAKHITVKYANGSGPVTLNGISSAAVSADSKVTDLTVAFRDNGVSAGAAVINGGTGKVTVTGIGKGGVTVNGAAGKAVTLSGGNDSKATVNSSGDVSVTATAISDLILKADKKAAFTLDAGSEAINVRTLTGNGANVILAGEKNIVLAKVNTVDAISAGSKFTGNVSLKTDASDSATAKMTIVLGAGNDTVEADNGFTRLTAHLGDGDNTLTLSNYTAGSIFVMGSGKDTVTINNTATAVDGRAGAGIVSINTGAGDDTIIVPAALTNFTTGTFDIDGGAGVNTLEVGTSMNLSAWTLRNISQIDIKAPSDTADILQITAEQFSSFGGITLTGKGTLQINATEDTDGATIDGSTVTFTFPENAALKFNGTAKGSHTYIASAGNDVITCGGGKDILVFSKDSGNTTTIIDEVAGFTSGADKLQFRGLAAGTKTNFKTDTDSVRADLATAVTAAETAFAGGFCYVLEKTGSDGYLIVDYNNDQKADLAIKLTAVTTIAATDIIAG